MIETDGDQDSIATMCYETRHRANSCHQTFARLRDIMRSRLSPRSFVMSTEHDRDYFTRRAGQERAVAARSDDPAARHIHTDLAARYDALAGGAAEPSAPPQAA
jgi:hypothetical protein